MRKYFLIVFCVSLFASPAYAFPDNGLLDNFTGCVDTTTPPNSNWTNAVFFGASSGTVDCEDLAATATTTGIEGDAYYNVTTFNADQEAYATVVNTASTVSAVLHVRLVNIGANTTDGYGVYWLDASSEVVLYRLDNAVPTTLSTFSKAITVGDKWGIRSIGSTHCAFFNDGGAGWVELGCAVDTTYSAGGRIGISVNGNTAVGAIDDVGGGNVTSTRRPIPPIFLQ